MNRYILFTVSILFALSSCRSAYYLPKPVAFKQHVKGLHFEGTLNDGEKVEGEIIAVVGERLFLRPNVFNDIKLHTISKSILEKGFIAVSTTSNNTRKIGASATLINILPLSHGYIGSLTIPVNILITTFIAHDAAKSTYTILYPKEIAWDDLYKFARFPQGIPAGVKLSDIK